MADDRDQILANFQAITCMDDMAECVEMLEHHDWNLEAAVQMAMALNDAPPSVGHINFNIPAETEPPSYSEVVHPQPPIVQPIPTSGPSEMVHSSGPSVNISPSTSRGPPDAQRLIRLLSFDIEYRDRNVNLNVPDDQTVGKLKELLEGELHVPAHRQLLRGWVTKNDCQIEDDELLRDLRLPKENSLYLLVPDIPILPSSAANGDDISLTEKLSQTFTLCITYRDKDRKYRLNFPGTKMVKEVKRDVSDIIDVPVRCQEWTGWPEAAKDEQMTLAGCGIDYSHNLIVSYRNADINCQGYERLSPEPIHVDTSEDEYTDAHDDFAADYEETINLYASDTGTRKQMSLMPPNAKDQGEALEQFMREFANRYGDCHPYFFIGTLDDAIREALQVKARERKLLAIYLHHDNSILANVFCSQVLCSESIVAYLCNNFITWAWDLSSQANKARLLTMCTHHFGSVAASTLRSFTTDQLPTLLVITRNRGSNEVFSVINGNSTVDEVMTSLISAVDVFQESQKGEILEEEERDARERMKQEQDHAYQESLAADKAKADQRRREEEERQRIADEAERQRQEEENTRKEEEAEKQAIALSLAEQLPSEPAGDSTERISMIRIKCPQGELLTRRFLAEHPLQILLNYVSSEGYHTDSYKVLTTFPRRDLTALDSSKSLEELNLYPQETLILEEKSEG